MKRAALIFAAALAMLIALAAAGCAFLFNTGAGRDFLLTQIEKQLGGALNSDAEIGALNGAPPGRIELHDIALKANEKTWLTIAQLEMRWRPFSLLSGAVRIDVFSVENARLLSAPPDTEDIEENNEPLSIRLPRDLPTIAADRIEIANLTAVVAGVEQRLDGMGALKMGGRALNARLDLTSSYDRDIADVKLNLNPDAGRVFIDAVVAAKPGGVIAGLAGLEAPYSVEVKSESPIDDADIQIDANFGDYGALNATITANLENLTGADAALLFTPGAALNTAPALSAPVVANLRAEERANGGALIIRSLGSAMGDITGEAVWRNRGRFVQSLTAELKAAIHDNYRSEMQGSLLEYYIGNEAALTGALEREGGEYALEATLGSGETRLSLTDGRTDLRRTLTGDVALTLPRIEAAPAPLSLGAEAAGAIDLTLDESITLRSFSLGFSDSSSMAGEGRFSFAEQNLSFIGDIEASPALLKNLMPSVSAENALSGDFELSGTVERLTLNGQIDTPALLMNENSVPPLTISTALAGLPSLPTGDITVEAQGGQGRFNAQLRSSVDGAVNIPTLSYAGAGFELNGSGALAPQRRGLVVDLTYNGQDEASPWPGLILSGDLNAKGVLSREGDLNQLSISSNALRANGVAVAGLEITAEGPPGATRVRLSSNELTAPNAGSIQDLSADATVNLEKTAEVSLRTFNAVIANTQATLTEPALIRFEDGVSIDNLRFAYGRDGLIALDGGVSNDRWRAQAALESVNIPQADGQLSLRLDLDTDRQTPAAGNFRLRSLLTRNQEAAVSGEFLWNGDSLIISNEQDADALDMRLSLPAQLVRNPAIAVQTTGPLAGYARYQGEAQAIAAYLPPELQTLEGRIDFNFNLGGDTNAPEISGQARIEEGQYTELQSGFALAGLHVEADASYDADGSVIAFTGGARGAGQNGGDTISLSGALNLNETSALNLEVNLNEAVLSARPVTGLRTNGRIVIDGPLNAIEASGDISIEELNAEIITPEDTGLVDIEVVAYNSDAQIFRANETAPPPSIDFNIALVADDRVFVRGRGLESEWSADIIAVNDNGAPLLAGRMALRRGWLDFSGRRFDLTRGVIAFDRLSPNNPTLDIRAEHETGDGVIAIIAVSGRADAPSIELQSTPSLPSEDVMALVLFGKPAQELSAVESLQTAEALASLGGVGPFGGEGITGRLRQTLGLDLLNLDIDPENGGGALTVGKYVADGVFVSATQDAQGRNGSVRVEYEVTDNITVETELAQDGEQTVSANWKRDF